MLEHDGNHANGATFDEAMGKVVSSLPLRKIKEYLDSTNLSADAKALLFDIANITIKVGEAVVAVGRRILDFAMGLMKRFPTATLGLLVAVTIVSIINIGAIPVIGAALTKLLPIIGLTYGAVEDIRQGAMKEPMDSFEAEFAHFRPAA